MTMSIEEALPWVYPTAILPDNALDPKDQDREYRERIRVWAKDNEASLREAMTVFFAARAEHFPPGVTIDPTGSMFCLCSPLQFPLPFYWNPTAIRYEHEGFVYTVKTPEHVAALHAFHDWHAAMVYLQGHFDKCEAEKPMLLEVPEGWDSEDVSMEAWETLQDRPWTRYTLYDWRKQREARALRNSGGIAAVYRYSEQNYDLKEGLDAQGNLLSCERGTVYSFPVRL
ncbi:hypothetical protein C8R45DRAFT_1088548 [Mycena sanguinolenta]|nr:hypothetical protein C8R45DRAFT_1088548 [Mycena sanguinolenta]